MIMESLSLKFLRTMIMIFFKIDANLFSPSKVIISNADTGNTFVNGKIDNDLMKKSFGI